MISFSNLYELFPAFICANNIGILVNNMFGVKIFNHVPVFFFKDFNSLLEQWFLLDLILLLYHILVVALVVNDLKQHQELSFLGLFKTFILFFWSFESLSYWFVCIFKSLSYNLEAVLIGTFPFSNSFLWSSLFGLIYSVS